jgi:GxxExxY protein
MGASMESDELRAEINRVTEKIINCAYRVSNALGSGFLEKVYENALAIELRQSGLRVVQQHPIKVFYNQNVVGDYVADLFIEDCVIVEMKTTKVLDEVHSAQCMNYLKATGLKVCLLLNFGKPRVDVKRIVLDF